MWRSARCALARHVGCGHANLANPSSITRYVSIQMRSASAVSHTKRGLPPPLRWRPLSHTPFRAIAPRDTHPLSTRRSTKKRNTSKSGAAYLLVMTHFSTHQDAAGGAVVHQLADHVQVRHQGRLQDERHVRRVEQLDGEPPLLAPVLLVLDLLQFKPAGDEGMGRQASKSRRDRTERRGTGRDGKNVPWARATVLVYAVRRQNALLHPDTTTERNFVPAT